MAELIEVQFKGNRRECFSWDSEHPISVGDSVVVELERGCDIGCVTAIGETAVRKNGTQRDSRRRDNSGSCPRKVLRRASAEDTHLQHELRKGEQDVTQAVVERVEKHGLVMKVSDAEWQWDRRKLTIYFTAEARVDFRALVRDLASLFRTRIELRQIGARDEAKRLDGVGRCGRRFCCASWLCDLKPVSLALAKDQRLSLNPSQISGGCGRLLCCLRYEHEFYATSRKKFPKEGRKVRTATGSDTVVSVDILRERVLLRNDDGTTRAATLAELKDEVQSLDKKATEAVSKPPSTLVSFDEGNEGITNEEAVEAVTPRKRKRRNRRGRRRNRNKKNKGDNQSDNKPKAGPENGRGE